MLKRTTKARALVCAVVQQPARYSPELVNSVSAGGAHAAAASVFGSLRWRSAGGRPSLPERSRDDLTAPRARRVRAIS